MSSRNVVITGLGVLAPGLRDYGCLDEVINRGDIACGPLTRFNTQECKTKLAFQIDPSLLPPIPTDPVRQPLIVRYGDKVLADALRMAGLTAGAGDPVCVFGTTVGGTWEMEACYGSLERFGVACRPAWTPLDAASLEYPGRLIFDPIRPGELKTVTTGCTAGLDALGIGWMEVMQGAECAIVLSAEAPLGPLVVTSFDQINALTKQTQEPLLASMPFSKNRCGFCIGEGAAAYVLENEDSARRRGARILAVVRGYSTVSSAFHMCAIHHEGEAIRRSMQGALEAGGVGAEDVGLIVAHATSTKQNDVAEHTAFASIFGEALASTPIYAGKANFGHALGSSNLIEMAVAVRALESGWVGPYARRNQRDIEFDDVLLPDKPMRLKKGIAIKNSSGFSGIHSAVVLEGRHVLD